MRDIKDYNSTLDLKLNQWRLFHAWTGDDLLLFDKQFGLTEGSTVPVRWIYRPREGASIPTEVVAVPMQRLAEDMATDRNP